MAERERFCLSYLIPATNNLFDKNYVNYAQLLLLVVEEYFLSKDTERGFEEALALFSPHAIAAGRRFREKYPLLEMPADREPSVGFVGHSVAISGYEVITAFGRYLTPFRPKMYAMRVYDTPYGQSTASAFKDGGIELITTKKKLYNVFALRRLLLDHPVDVAIWPMPPFHMFFLFSFGLAPKQIFLSQYLRPGIEFDYLDEVMTLGGAGTLRKKVFNGREWKIVPQVARIEGASDDSSRRYLFTPARLEKLKQPEFLSCVVRILKDDERTYFKWTGYYRDNEVVHFFRRAGLAERNIYVPWMNSHSLVREILDSHAILACFPLSLGTVEYIAARHGIPIVSMFDEQFNLYWRDIYWEATNGNDALQRICLNSDGTSKILIARTKDEYVATALRVINEPDLAKTYADVYKRSYEYCYDHNPNDIGAIFRDVILNLHGRGSGTDR